MASRSNSKSPMKIIWEDDLTPKLATALPGLNRAINALMLSQAPKVQDAARAGAPWTDRTGAARNGLFAKNGGGGGSYFIELYHTVPYGIYLETRWSGKYQIIVPTIDSEGRRIMGLAKGLIATLGAAT